MPIQVLANIYAYKCVDVFAKFDVVSVNLIVSLIHAQTVHLYMNQLICNS